MEFTIYTAIINIFFMFHHKLQFNFDWNLKKKTTTKTITTIFRNVYLAYIQNINLEKKMLFY